MIYFADLTPYSYYGAVEDERIVNVGWLSKDHDFPRGAVPQDFINELAGLLKSPTNLFRGFHQCEFCPPPDPQAARASGLRMVANDRDTMGNGEIRVHGLNGTIYAAPVLALHYVTAHGYLPPKGFVDAVLRGSATHGTENQNNWD